MKGYPSQHSRNGWIANKKLKSVHEPTEEIWSARNVGIKQYLERWSLSLGLNASVAENVKVTLDCFSLTNKIMSMQTSLQKKKWKLKWSQ